MKQTLSYGEHQGSPLGTERAESCTGEAQTGQVTKQLFQKATIAHQQINRGFEILTESEENGQLLTRGDLKPTGRLAVLLTAVPTRTTSQNHDEFIQLYSELRGAVLGNGGKQSPANKEKRLDWYSLYTVSCFVAVYRHILSKKHDASRKKLHDASRLVKLVNHLVDYGFRQHKVAAFRVYDALSAAPSTLAKPIESSESKDIIAPIAAREIKWPKTVEGRSWVFYPFHLIVAKTGIKIDEVYQALGFDAGSVFPIFGKEILQQKLLMESGESMAIPVDSINRAVEDHLRQSQQILHPAPWANLPFVQGNNLTWPQTAPCVGLSVEAIRSTRGDNQAATMGSHVPATEALPHNIAGQMDGSEEMEYDTRFKRIGDLIHNFRRGRPQDGTGSLIPRT
ncbi:hypothetical protein MAJ_10083, partial [Metarhizium majus ARSEF 297]